MHTVHFHCVESHENNYPARRVRNEQMDMSEQRWICEADSRGQLWSLDSSVDPNPKPDAPKLSALNSIAILKFQPLAAGC